MSMIVNCLSSRMQKAYQTRQVCDGQMHRIEESDEKSLGDEVHLKGVARYRARPLFCLCQFVGLLFASCVSLQESRCLVLFSNALIL